MRPQLVILLILFSNYLYSQSTYLNTSYNPNNTWSIGNSIIEYNDSYYITGGTSDSIAGYQSIFISNIDLNGDLIYWKTIGGYPFSFWSGYSNALIPTTSLGEMVLAGSRSTSGSSSSAMYYNFQINGDTNYTVRYPDTNFTGFTSFHQCKQTFDGGFIFVGKMTIEQYNSDILLIKTDHAGNEEWRQHYGKNITWAIDHGYNVLETADSGYLIGYYFHIAGQEETGNPYMLKVDKFGNYEWELNLGGPYADYLATVCHSNDGNYLCVASISDSVSGDNLFTKVNIFKISPNGDIIWSKTIGDLHLWNKAYGIYKDHNEGYIICGLRYDFFEDPFQYDNSRGWICKIDENGDSLWWREYKHFTDPEWHMNHLYDLNLTTDGGYVAIGQTATIWETKTWIMKVDSFGCDTQDCQTVTINEPHESTETSIFLYPNPASSCITVKIPKPLHATKSVLFIYDSYGRLQEEVVISGGQKSVQILISQYSSGVYHIVLKNKDRFICTNKFIKK